MGSIYKITNTVNGKAYIGQTRYDAEKTRIRDHLNGNSRGSELVQRAVEKYGKDAFTYEILHDGIIPEFLDTLEMEAIEKFNTLVPHGYNLTTGGSNGTRSEETKRKMSESVRKTFAESPEIWFEAQRKATEAAAEKNKGKQRPAEIRDKISIGHRKSDYKEMHDFFLSLPADMHFSIKVRLLREQFPDVSKSTLYFRVRKWTGVKTKKQHPDYPEVYKFFITLPSTMSLPEKRHLLHKQFPNVRRHYINKWLNKWSGTKTLKRHPDYSDVNDLFLSLPAEMSLSEKRRLLYEQFPNVKRDTIRSWLRKWQSELTPKGEQK